MWVWWIPPGWLKQLQTTSGERDLGMWTPSMSSLCQVPFQFPLWFCQLCIYCFRWTLDIIHKDWRRKTRLRETVNVLPVVLLVLRGHVCKLWFLLLYEEKFFTHFCVPAFCQAASHLEVCSHEMQCTDRSTNLNFYNSLRHVDDCNIVETIV